MKKIIIIALIISASFLVFVRSNTKIYNTDFWFELSIGRFIAQNYNIPKHDAFTYTYDKQWHEKSWLYNLLIYAVYSAAGFTGLSILKILTIFFIYFFLFKITGNRNQLLFFSAVILTLPPLSIRFLMRPEIFTYLFTAIFLYVLETRKNPFFLLPVFVVWVNMQGLYLIGLFIAGAYALQAIIEHKAEAKRLIWTTALLIILISISPFGLSGYTFPFVLLKRILHGPEFSKRIAEFVSPFSNKNVAAMWELSFFRVLLVLSAVPLFVSVIKKRIAAVVVFLTFALLSVMSIRNIPFFVIALFLILKDMRFKIKKYVWMPAAALLIIFALWLAAAFLTNNMYIRNKTSPRTGLGYNKELYPTEMVEFYKNNLYGRRIFNDISSGGLIEWICGAKNEVFIDGRLEMAQDAFYNEYFDAIYNLNGFRASEKKYGFNTVILTLSTGEGITLFKKLILEPGWRIAYLDDKGVIFVKKGTYAGQAALPKTVTGGVVSRRKFDLSEQKFYNRVKNPFYKYASYMFWPEYPEDMAKYAVIYYAMDKTSEALYFARRTIKQYPYSAYMHYILGNLFVKKRQMKRAFTEYRIARALSNSAEYAFKLGYVYQVTGNYTRAIKYYKKVKYGRERILRSDYNLAITYLKTGNARAAKRYARKVYAVNPNYLKIGEIMRYTGRQ